MKKIIAAGAIALLAGIGSYGAVQQAMHTDTDLKSIQTTAPAEYATDSGTEMNATHIEASTNQIRVRNGLNRLKTSNLLVKSACLKLDDMAQKDYWGHNAPDGTTPWYYFNKVEYRYKSAGENLAYGQNNVPELMKQWMNSPEHKENILDKKWDEQGVCTKFVHFQGEDTWLTVHHFGVRN